MFIIFRWSHTDPVWIRWAFAGTVGRTVPNDYVLPTVHHGGNFVDLNLEVVVQQATGTVMAFQPQHLHGTTLTARSMNYILSLSSTERVRAGFLHTVDTVARFLDCEVHE